MGVNTTRLRAILGGLPLRPTIAAAVILGLALPASLVAWHEVNDRRQTLFDGLASDHLRMVETLANGMQTPIWDVRPDTARPLIDVIMGDSRVTAVSVTAPVLPEPLTASKPETEGDDTVALERDVVRDGRQIGRVRVEMTTAPLKAEAAHQGWQALLTTMFQMAFGLLLIFPLVRFKVLAPLGQLVDQSRQLAAGELDQPFDWSRGDELGALGRSFEETRRSLQALFRDLEQRNAELRLREQALSESEELYRLLVDLSPHGILLHDEGAILFVNPVGCRTLGATAPGAIVGRRYRELVAPDDREQGEEWLKRILQGESIGQAERRLVTLDGGEIVVAISGVPFTRGEQRLALVIFVDITEMKQAQEEIARQRETLHQVEKISALGSLLAGVAHELNNPLSVVVGRATLLGEADLEPEVADGVAKIRAAADRCARIVKTFLAMARQQAPARAPVRIDRLIELALDLLAYGLDSAGIRVIKRLPLDLPETMADPDQLAQVFTNLITNAKQAMIGWHGPRELRIAATWDRSVNVVRVSIRDSGPGIPKRVRGRIFDPFFTTKPEGAGTGIGLAVCRGIVEAHGGTIAVDEVDAGASFVVTIPVVGTAVPTVRADSEEKPAAVDRMKILIVDDEPDIRKMLGEILRVDGHLVEEVANGREALARLEESRFDLVISDLIMPVLDGPGLYEELRRREPKTVEHLLFITGDTLSPTVRQFLDRVERPVIEKPFIPAEVRSAVRAAVDHGEPQQSREAGSRPVT